MHLSTNKLKYILNSSYCNINRIGVCYMGYICVGVCAAELTL